MVWRHKWMCIHKADWVQSNRIGGGIQSEMQTTSTLRAEKFVPRSNSKKTGPESHAFVSGGYHPFGLLFHWFHFQCREDAAGLSGLWPCAIEGFGGDEPWQLSLMCGPTSVCLFWGGFRSVTSKYKFCLYIGALPSTYICLTLSDS